MPTINGLWGLGGAAARHQLPPGFQVSTALLLHANEVVELLHHCLLPIGQLRWSDAICPGFALELLDQPAGVNAFIMYGTAAQEHVSQQATFYSINTADIMQYQHQVQYDSLRFGFLHFPREVPEDGLLLVDIRDAVHPFETIAKLSINSCEL